MKARLKQAAIRVAGWFGAGWTAGATSRLVWGWEALIGEKCGWDGCARGKLGFHGATGNQESSWG